MSKKRICKVCGYSHLDKIRFHHKTPIERMFPAQTICFPCKTCGAKENEFCEGGGICPSRKQSFYGCLGRWKRHNGYQGLNIHSEIR